MTFSHSLQGYLLLWYRCISHIPYASDKYPTMQRFVAGMCTHAHISVTNGAVCAHSCYKWCIVGYGTGAIKSSGTNNAVISFHGDGFAISRTLSHNVGCCIIIVTVGHRRQVTAVTRLPRWRRRKPRLEVRPPLIMLRDMDRCDFWHANRNCIWLTCYTVMFGHYASEWSSGALVFSGGRRVPCSKEVGD